MATLSYCVLGSKAGGVPTPLYYPAAVAARIEGDILLIDCGEGTQNRLVSAGISRSAITHVFITHTHGDHIFGLLPLLTSMASDKRTSKLTLVGPSVLQDYVESNLTMTGATLTFPVEYIQAKEHILDGPVVATRNWRLVSAKANHRIEAYAYRIETLPVVNIDIEALKIRGNINGKDIGILKSEGSLELPDGDIVHLEEVSAISAGKSLTISGDTMYSPDVFALAFGTQVLIHEATFSHKDKKKALEYYHSTATEAALFAVTAAVKKLVLTHISNRYKVRAAIEEEAQRLFHATSLAEELQWCDV